MTREEWINEILIPWKPGDVLAFWSRLHQRWKDIDMRGVIDPVHYDWCGDDKFRIKPRMEKWIIEIPEEWSQGSVGWGELADLMKGHFHRDMTNAVRNARRGYEN